ncbi:unnamed protein product [Ectocarpus sp. 8 AP-2014]
MVGWRSPRGAGGAPETGGTGVPCLGSGVGCDDTGGLLPHSPRFLLCVRITKDAIPQALVRGGETYGQGRRRTRRGGQGNCGQERVMSFPIMVMAPTQLWWMGAYALGNVGRHGQARGYVFDSRVGGQESDT